MTKFSQKANYWFTHNEEQLVFHDTLPVGNYTIKANPMTGFYLEKIEEFKPLTKVYGNVPNRAERILQTFAERPFQTGLLLAGEKGSGKTLLARQISIAAYEAKVPTIIINEPFAGESFMEFLASITQPKIVLFDEFEKVYAERGTQQSILTLLDGVFPTKTLFIMTVNEAHRLDVNMINRPGRIFYNIKYDGLDAAFIEEYIKDNLDNQANAPGIIKIVSLFSRFNFDMLKALVEEMNRYEETAPEALKLLNISPEYDSTTYNVEIIEPNGLTVTHKNTTHFSPFQVMNPLTQPELQVSYYHPVEKEGPEKDAENKWIEMLFTLNDIQKVDNTGILFKNELGYQMKLTKEAPKYYDWRAF